MSITKNMLLNWYSSMKKNREIWMIFDTENWPWKSNLGTFWQQFYFFWYYRNARGLRTHQKRPRNSFKNLQYGKVHLYSFCNWARRLWWSWFYNAKKIRKTWIYCWHLPFEILFILQTRHSASFYQTCIWYKGIYFRVCHNFLDFKVSRYIEGYSFWSIWGP